MTRRIDDVMAATAYDLFVTRAKASCDQSPVDHLIECLLDDRAGDMAEIARLTAEVERLTTWHKWPEDEPCAGLYQVVLEHMTSKKRRVVAGWYERRCKRWAGIGGQGSAELVVYWRELSDAPQEPQP